MTKVCLLSLIFIFFLPFYIYSADYYVSPEGPFTSINRAVNQVPPGSRVLVKAGIYRERVVLKGLSGITLESYGEGRAIIDGSGFEGDDWDSLILIEDSSSITVSGFEVRNLRATGKEHFPAAILVKGSGQDIGIYSNYVHHIEQEHPEGGAHGIALYGTKSSSLSNIKIDGNEIAHCKLGLSEALALNGNVERFEVTNNLVHDNNNIAIVFIGFEKTCPDRTQDRARDGLCRNNWVYNIDCAGNPSYGNEKSAGGIYVDGGTAILIEENRVFNCNIGIEVASEWGGRDASYIKVRNNLLYHNELSAISIGGYDRWRGAALYCEISGNTLYMNNTLKNETGEIHLQYYCRQNVIKNNIIYANSQALFINNSYRHNKANSFDHNIYYSDNRHSALWRWRGRSYRSFEEWQKGSGQGQHSTFSKPEIDRALLN